MYNFACLFECVCVCYKGIQLTRYVTKLPLGIDNLLLVHNIL